MGSLPRRRRRRKRRRTLRKRRTRRKRRKRMRRRGGNRRSAAGCGGARSRTAGGVRGRRRPAVAVGVGQGAVGHRRRLLDGHAAHDRTRQRGAGGRVAGPQARLGGEGHALGEAKDVSSGAMPSTRLLTAPIVACSPGRCSWRGARGSARRRRSRTPVPISVVPEGRRLATGEGGGVDGAQPAGPASGAASGAGSQGQYRSRRRSRSAMTARFQPAAPAWARRAAR